RLPVRTPLGPGALRPGRRVEEVGGEAFLPGHFVDDLLDRAGTVILAAGLRDEVGDLGKIEVADGGGAASVHRAGGGERIGEILDRTGRVAGRAVPGVDLGVRRGGGSEKESAEKGSAE